ncbi:hypothetical protein CC79DRAFT_1368466 [Sarocladium strictum]
MGPDPEETTGFISPNVTYVPSGSTRSTKHLGLRVCVAVLGVLNIVTLFLLFRNTRPEQSRTPDLLYSPVQDEVSYKVVHFHNDSAEETVYQHDPSPHVDAAWEALYMPTVVSSITADEAARLDSSTLRDSSDPSRFVVSINVFHQLYCLDSLRKMLYPEHYVQNKTEEELREGFIDLAHKKHCTELLRQAIMCHADIGPILYTWDEDLKSPFPLLYNDHTCRDFDRIQSWAMQRQVSPTWGSRPSK